MDNEIAIPKQQNNNQFSIEIKVEELRKRKLFVATPCYGGQCTAMYAKSISDLSSLCTNYGIPLQMYFLSNESLVQRSRNYITDEFMRSDSTHLMFIDADIGFEANDVIALLALSSDESEYDIIGGAYAKKNLSWEKIKVAVDKGFADENPENLSKFVGDYVFNPVGNVPNIPLFRPSEVLELGTGFMMIKRSTFEKFNKEYTSSYYRPDHVRTAAFDGTRKIVAYFDCPIDRGYWFEEIHKLITKVGKGEKVENIEEKLKELYEKEQKASLRYLSEDYYFCRAVRDIGLKIWLCPWMKLSHTGSYIFGGSLVDIAALGVSPTADVSLLQKNRKNK